MFICAVELYGKLINENTKFFCLIGSSHKSDYENLFYFPTTNIFLQCMHIQKKTNINKNHDDHKVLNLILRST